MDNEIKELVERTKERYSESTYQGYDINWYEVFLGHFQKTMPMDLAASRASEAETLRLHDRVG